MNIVAQRARVLIGGALLVLLLSAFAWPWAASPWPRSAEQPPPVLGYPALESVIAQRAKHLRAGLRFAVFGDQRALADGEWQAIIAAIAARSAADSALCFVIDTGDIVNDGRYSDQFAVLAGILAPLRGLPYLVAVGNHELCNDRYPEGRANTAAFLEGLDPDFSPARLYFCKDVPGARLLFLDSNALVYGEGPAAKRRASEQLDWLTARLADAPAGASRIVVMHHPLVQSSRKHREQAVALWSLEHAGRRLPDILLDGGVDLVLCGHTHTFERFAIERADGRRLQLVNISGRPRDDFLWIGSGPRHARDIAGRELDWLADKGWRDLAGWRIEQLAAMVDDEANQFGLFTLAPDGGLTLEMHFLERSESTGVRREAPVTLN